MKRILLVDDDAEFIKIIQERMSPNGKNNAYEIIGCSRPSEVEATVKTLMPALVLLDIDFGSGFSRAGLDILKKLRQHWSKTELPIIILSGIGDDNRVLEKAFKIGANDYLQKPPDIEDLLQRIDSILAKPAPAHLTVSPEEEILVGQSMINVMKEIIKAAQRSMDVLFVGETGTGKEIASKIYHRHSPRSQLPMVVVNCPAIPSDQLEAEVYGSKKGSYTSSVRDKKGLAEEANGGILYFDEISCLPLPQQPKLLRLIRERKYRPIGDAGEERKADVIILGATNQNLKDLVKRKRFKEDLYFRFSRYVIEIPPLRERTADIELLARHFMDKYNDKNILGIDDKLLELFTRLPWPGNVDQLQVCIRNGILRCEGRYLGLKDVKADLSTMLDPSGPATTAMPDKFCRMNYKVFESYLKDETLRLKMQFYSYYLGKHHNNIARTAKALGMTAQYLHQILKSIGLKANRIPDNTEA